MKVVIIDNYDSFTYNLRHIVCGLGCEATVVRNDRFVPDSLMQYDKILLSPGPGVPSRAGLMPEVIRLYASIKPILGVCLGMQGIGEVFGGTLRNLKEVYHGVQTPVYRCADDYIFAGLPAQFPAARYHSWVVERATLPESLEVTATSAEGHIMALKHRLYDVHGLQFHPESVMTPDGCRILASFLNH